MDRHHHGGARTDGGLEITQMRAVRGAHLDQLAAGARHDVGHAECAADLDQLAARDRHLLFQRQCVQHKQHGGGVVVDHGGGFRAGQPAQPVFQMGIAVAAPRRLDIIFQVAGAGRHGGHRGHCLLGQDGAAEIGMQHRAGQVEHRAQRRREPRADALGDIGDDCVFVDLGPFLREPFTQIGQRLTRALDHDGAAMARD